MSTERSPFSALHWRFRHEFPEVWCDDHALALWTRLLVLADTTYPEPAPLPAGYRKTALAMLTKVELVMVLPDGSYLIRGQKKERERRQAAAAHAAKARWAKERGDAPGNA